MKKLYITAISTLLILGVSAQKTLDRSKQPIPGPAPVISITDPVQYTLPNGIIVLVVENHKLPKVSATYSIDAGPVTEGSKAGVLDIMGQMLSEGTTNRTKAAFDEATDQMGADISLSSSGGNVSALTRYFNKAFLLMVEALRKPAFPQESFDKIKSLTITGIKANDKNANAISSRVVNALVYGTDHPNGEFTSETTVNGLTLQDVKNAYTSYITPSRGYLTFVGDITPEQAKALAVKAFGDWKGVALSLPKLKEVANPSKTEIDVTDVPSAVQSELTVTNLISLPLSNPDYFAVLLANQILGGSADARLFMNLREKHGYTYGAYSRTGYGRFQTTFSASASVRNEKADSAVIEFLNEIQSIRNIKVSEEELKNAKALYNGTFALSLEDPARTAAFASNVLINNLPKDFYKTYLQKINAVTTDDVERVAKKYFNYDNTRIIAVGKAEVILPGLKKLGYTVNQYDKFAKPATANTPIAVNISANDIIAKYIAAIGGADELKKVNSYSSTGEMTVQGTKLTLTEKKLAPNLELTEMQMGGQTVVHEVFDGAKGYQTQMGNKKDMTDEELADKKDEKGLFPQLYYNDGTFKLEVAGVEKVGDANAYKIKVTGPSGKASTEYYV